MSSQSPETRQDPHATWSVVVLAYNEQDTIIDVIVEIQRVMSILASDYEILVVDDGSDDATAKRVNSLLNQISKLRLISHDHNQGIGAALKSGYQQAIFENVCAVPGDGQFAIERLLDISWPQPPNQVICFYRRTKKGYSAYRQWLSISHRSFNKIFFNLSLRDINWVKVYKKSHLKETSFTSPSSFVESEICHQLHKKGYHFQEHPSDYLPRQGGVSHGGDFQHALRALRDAGSYLYQSLKKASRSS